MADQILSLLLFLLLAGALAAFLLSRRLRSSAGLPGGARVVYSDTGAWKKQAKPLFSQRYLLTGKPDYVVEEGGLYIPVEVKPNRNSEAPLPWDELQLAAYGLLLGEAYGRRPPYGLLKYRAAVFQVDLEDELYPELLRVMEEMREDLGASEVDRSHDDPGRCRTCGYRQACDQRLEDRN